MLSKWMVKLLVVVFLFNVFLVPVVKGEAILPQTVEKAQVDQSNKPSTFGIWARFFGGFASIAAGVLVFPLYPPAGFILVVLGARLLWDSASMSEDYKRALELEEYKRTMQERLQPQQAPATATTVILDPTSDL